jgi:hypothetical protein
MNLAKKSTRQKSSKIRARQTKLKAVRKNIVETARKVRREKKNQENAAEHFADVFLMDFGIRG